MNTCGYRKRHTCGLLVLLGSVLLLSGCGTGSYQELQGQRLEALGKTAPFLVLYQAGTDIPETNLTLRFPMQFKAVHTDPNKLPAFFQLPGFKFGYEASDKDAKNVEYGYECYVAAKGLKPEEKPGFETELVDALKGTFPDAAWTSIDVPTPEGTQLNWKRISVKGDQPFGVTEFGTKQTKTVDGYFDLWLHEGETGDVLVLWRIPSALEEKVGLRTLAERTAGTLTVKAAPPAAEPAAAAAQ